MNEREGVDLLILGLGNVLMSDDGAGVRAVEYLMKTHRPGPGVCILDGGTLGLSLLPYVVGAGRIILVDAVALDAAPGTVVHLDGEAALHAAHHRLSVHQLGVADLLWSAQLRKEGPLDAVLVGVAAGRITLGEELSPDVARSIPALARAVRDQARAMGFEITPEEAAHAQIRPDGQFTWPFHGPGRR